jgi:hypothetical protein
LPDVTAPTVHGQPLHTRSLTVNVSARADGPWHARGDVIDLRKNGFVPTSYDLQPSGVIHMMSIELDFDPATLVLSHVRVEQPFVAIEPSETTGGECCRDPAPILEGLAGEALDAGFPKTLGARFGGALGCSHLLTLFQLMASAVPHAVSLEHARAEREGSPPEPDRPFFRRSVFVDGHAPSRAQTEVAIQLADTHTRPLRPGDRVTERLALSHEVRTFAAIDRKRFLIDRLDVRERRRTAETVGTTDWIDHGTLLAPLLGVRLIPGLAARLFSLLGDRPELRPVLDNLLQFAPGFIQIIAARMDEYYEERAARSDPGSQERPAVATIGGNKDSCYMWRGDGPVQRAWDREHAAEEAG